MDHVRLMSLLLLAGLGLCACQSSQSRKEQLAAICADPVNRQPQNFYYSECLTLYPLTNAQQKRNQELGAPVGY